MGDPKHLKKRYGTPKKPWDGKLLETERKLLDNYGLKNKREVRRMDALLRKKRRMAKHVLALPLEKRAASEKELIDSLINMGIMRGSPHLNDVLSLNIEAFLERRLETIVWRKHLANTIKQARQFITHGHIGINGQKVTVPSYLVSKADEKSIAYYGTPMVLSSPEMKKRDNAEVEKQMAEMRGEPEGHDSVQKGEEDEAAISPDAAAAAEEGK
jgi:small subunit ribosomal protein S4